MKVKAVAFLSITTLLFLSTGPIHAATPAIVGYYPSWVADQLPPEDVRFDVFTNIVYAFAWPKNDASIETYSSRVYTSLIEAAHKKDVKVSIALGGGGQTGGFPTVTGDPALRAAFIENIIAFCETNGFDGADFDWEFPETKTERDNYAALIRELRAETSQRNAPFVISLAISAASWTSLGNDYADLSGTVDWFMVMAYDYSGPWTTEAGHNAPLYSRSDLGFSLSVKRSIDYLIATRKFAPESLVLGIPFYGRSFNANRIYAPATGGDALQYATIANLIQSDTWRVMWDAVSKAPFLVNADSTKVIVYDDPASVAIKCTFAQERHLGGVGVWALGYDASSIGQPLVEAIMSVYGGVLVEKESDSVRPVSIALSDNYPNPFNASTMLDIRVDREEAVTLRVYSITGSIVATLVSENLSAGVHQVRWDAGELPSGVYLCRLDAGGKSVAKKMTLLK